MSARPHPISRWLAALLAAVWLCCWPLAAPGRAGAPWRAPVPGPVLARFATGPDPFAAGQRRGIDLRARPGERAVAPCAGTVTFAGPLPRRGDGVSIACGALTATILGLAAPTVDAGTAVAAGDQVGTAAGSRIRLGARRSAQRFGYVDPERLLGASAAGRPLAGPAARRGPGRGPSAAPVRIPAAAPRWSPRPVPPRAGVPLTAWIGLALLAVAVPVGALAARRPARARAAAAVARPVSAR
ncbi:MAG TPA: M23 family metallopeptidase [Capillimicrobium sp.]|nr:M23 family metallopeptidase [Capillimicrobium sp.]